jgi:hypothetical protein
MESGMVTFPGVRCFPLCRCVDLMEWMGEMSAVEAARWKHGISGLMEPVDLTPTSDPQ